MRVSEYGEGGGTQTGNDILVETVCGDLKPMREEHLDVDNRDREGKRVARTRSLIGRTVGSARSTEDWSKVGAEI